MLTFEIKLSFGACQILAACSLFTDYYQSLDAKGRANKNELSKVWSELFDTRPGHFVTQAGQLRRNALLVESEDKHRHWLLTPKGRLVAELVGMEFEEARKEMKALNTRVVPQLKK